MRSFPLILLFAIALPSHAQDVVTGPLTMAVSTQKKQMVVVYQNVTYGPAMMQLIQDMSKKEGLNVVAYVKLDATAPDKLDAIVYPTGSRRPAQIAGLRANIPPQILGHYDRLRARGKKGSQNSQKGRQTGARERRRQSRRQLRELRRARIRYERRDQRCRAAWRLQGLRRHLPDVLRLQPQRAARRRADESAVSN